MGFFDLFKIKKHDQFNDEGNIICPECQSVDIVDIVYGYPSNDLIKDSHKGKVRLGGCCVDRDNPRWVCEQCNYEWK